MNIKKLLSCITSAIVILNCTPIHMMPSVIETSAESDASETTTNLDFRLDSDETVEHAYNPMSEIEAKQAEELFRESADIVEKKVLFSVIDFRNDKTEVKYINESDPICKANKLRNVSFIYETQNETYTPPKGFISYEVFYEATTSVDDVWSVVDDLNENEAVISAEPDFIWKNTAEGSYSEVSKAEYEAETYFNTINAQEVWDSLNPKRKAGKGSVVAVIDTGVDYTHKDLVNNIWENPGEIPGNGIDDDYNGYIDDVHGIDLIEKDGAPMDDHGHGTHVAGIIAMTPNEEGGVGLAYNSKIMCIKAGQSDGTFASSDIAKAIKYAADNGADVINMSFGGAGKSGLVEAALKDAFATTILVASAGNDGLPTTDASELGYVRVEDIYPAGYSYVIGVMATNDNNQLADFSNWDYLEGYNCEYELSAPGVEIFSTLPNNRYARWSGTSMAAPIVAASAAIIRSEHPEKNKYTSRYIMGQLISATETNILYKGKLGDVHSYQHLNLIDSLNKTPKPEIHLKDTYILDSEEINKSNNNDGIAQPGEIIDLGLSVWNRWGTAKEVTIKVDAISDGGVSNPYVEFINDTITIGEVGSFAEVNNGWNYKDGMFTNVTNPIRLKIKEGSPNDAHIKLNFTITAKNDMDSQDTNTYYSNSSFTILIQNGYTLSGVIRNDMILTADKYWIIESSVLIPEGVTVTVEPGAQIQFWSSEPNNPYSINSDLFLQVEGKFIAEGTAEKPINIFPCKNYEKKGILIWDACSGWISDCFPYNSRNYDCDEYTMPEVDGLWAANKGTDSRGRTGKWIIDPDFDSYYVSLKYTNIIGLAQNSHITNIDHCYIVQNKYLDEISAYSITNTIIDAISGAFACKINAFKFSNCMVTDTAMFEISNKWMYYYFASNSYNYYRYKKNIMNNVLYFNEGTTNLNVYEKDIIINNAILKNEFRAPKIKSEIGHNIIDVSNNYWGTDNAKLVKKQVIDADSNVSLNDLVQEPFLTLNDDLSSIYPFMTEAYITDKNGNKIDTVSGSQTVDLHVKFNRDMAQDVQPFVTYGGSAPYTDYLVYGKWIAPREWVGEIKIEPFIDMGKMYVRTKGAAAADDKWLVTGEDSARFFFEITKTSAQSMSLQGSGRSGENELFWIQDDYDTLAGYNVYRALSYDKNIDLSKQYFNKVNTSIISADEHSFTDKNVNQGVDYYYYFTVVDTAFNESEASNVIKCTPLDEIAPEIVHSAVKSAIPGEAIILNAIVTDNLKIDNVKLNYRIGNNEWQSIPMKNVYENNYRGQISAYEVENEQIEYYITAFDGNNISSNGTNLKPYVITVLKLDRDEITLDINQTYKIRTNIKNLKYTSNNTEIATVNETGVITAISPGNTEIKISTEYGKTVIFRVTVSEPLHDIINQPESITVTAGEKAIFTVEARGEGLKYTWYYKLPTSRTYKKYADNMTNEFSMSTSKSKDGTLVYCLISDINGEIIKTNTVKLNVN